MSRPIRATISLAAIEHNLARVRESAPRSRIWAVVKADAYGHGLGRVLPALGAADGVALLEMAAAERLREQGYAKPILLLEGCFSGVEVARAQSLGLASVVHAPDQIEMLERAAPGAPLNVFLKMNSGMNRLGFTPADYASAFARLRAAPAVGTIGLMTHFARADAVDGVQAALECFDSAAAALPGERCLANSAAILLHAQTHRDWVRPGIMLYGATPAADHTAHAFGLRPAMTLASELIAVQALRPGAAVGYGGRFVADRPMRIGVVACGYADGYPRSAPNGTPVIVAGVRCPLAGTVSMDMIAVDVSGVPEAQVGAPVELWGESLAVDEVATAAGTVGYELLCALAPRVPVEVR